MGAQKPLVGVNHLAGHALTPRMTDAIEYPYLMLLISGGHCQFLIVKGTNQFVRLGGTIDDAPGEAFDKTARLLGLPQPGGPSIDATARDGDPTKFALPRPLLDRAGCDMSFSGLKTAVLRVRDEIVVKRVVFINRMSTILQPAFKERYQMSWSKKRAVQLWNI